MREEKIGRGTGRNGGRGDIVMMIGWMLMRMRGKIDTDISGGCAVGRGRGPHHGDESRRKAGVIGTLEEIGNGTLGETENGIDIGKGIMGGMRTGIRDEVPSGGRVGVGVVTERDIAVSYPEWHIYQLLVQ